MTRSGLEAAADLWEDDGSLRDVYVRKSVLEDWKRLVELAATYQHEYLIDGQLHALPTIEDIFANRRGTHLLRIHVGSAMLNTHFFAIDEIELDISPRELALTEDRSRLIEFLENLAHRLDKPVTVTPEGGRDTPFAWYEPATKLWRS